MRPIDADALIERVMGKGLKPITEQIFRKLIDDAPTVNQWIPCSERLPETAEEVLVYLFGGNPYLAWFDGDEWQTNDFTVDDDERPIAWMPLPKEWKGEEDETANK